MAVTWDEWQQQLDAEGVTDIHERNRRTAEMVQSGQLVEGTAPEATESEVELVDVTPEMGQPAGQARVAPASEGVVGAMGSVLRGLPFERLTGSEIPYGALPQDPQYERDPYAGAGGTQPPEQTGTWTPQQAAQMPQQMAQAGMQGMGMPQFPMMGAPSTKGISKAMASQQKAYEEQAAGLQKSTGKYQEAIRERAGVEADAIRQEAELMETRDRAMEQLEAERIEREQERQAYMEQEVGKVREAVESINESGIDPYRFYRHPDGGVDYVKSIGSAIAIGLGALASSLPAQYGGGGPNVALQIVERAIERDLQAQRDDLANRRAGVGLQMNLLGQMRAKFTDERQAEQAARMVMLETYKNKLQTTSAESADDKILANAEVMSSQVDQKLAEISGNIATNAAAAYTQGQTQLFSSELARRQQLQAQREKKFGVEAAQAQAAMKGEGSGMAFPGAQTKEGYVPTEKDKEKAQPLVAAWDEASKLLDELLAWRKEYGQEKLSRGALKTANTKLHRLRSAMRGVDEAGANLSENEVEMMGLNFEMGDIGYVTEALQAVKDSVRDKVSAKIGVHGYSLANPRGRMAQGFTDR